MPQGVRGVTPSSVGDVDFLSAALQKKRIDNFIRNETATEVDIFQLKPLPELYFQVMKLRVNFLLSTAVKVASKNANRFKVLPDACSKHRCDSETSDVVPDSLRVLRDVACSSTSMGELQQYYASISMATSGAESKLIDRAARQRNRSSTWYTARAGRVTASRLQAICHTCPVNPVSLVKHVC